MRLLSERSSLMVFSAFLLSFQKPGEAEKSSFSAILAFIAAGSKTPPNFLNLVFHLVDRGLELCEYH